MDRERSRAFQELFVNLFRRRRASQMIANGNATSPARDLYWALNDVSFTIEPGESVGLVGVNGAGKSTALKLISKIILPSSGSVTVNGRVSALLELGAGFHPELSGRDNIFLNGTVMGMTRKQIAHRLDEIIEFADVGEFIDVPVKDYSSGMQARLGFAVAVHLDPQIVLVDEALAVGDEAFQQKCNERMLELRRKGITMLYVSHSLEAIEQVCKRAIWLHKGKVRMDDTAHRVASAYHRASLRRQKRDAALNEDVRPGSGEARVTRIDLLDGNRLPIDFAETNQTVCFRIHYKAQQRIENPVIGLGFHNEASGVHISGPNNTMTQTQLPALSGVGYVDYCVDRLPLLPGQFRVEAALFDWNVTHCYDHHDRALIFSTVAGISSERHGLIALNGRWLAPEPA
jgi:ABC-type polysaccharide/polyol phosphate transport system ATPase subunit